MSDDERNRALEATSPEELQEIALRLFHQLWGRDQGRQGYNKRQWTSLQLTLNRLGVKV
jgi:hypothetical protein